MSSTSIRPTPAAPDALHVAPYLTHVVAHHGQLTLIPPQNAGRIRKAKKKRPPTNKSPDEEPRFTTAVPPSTSKRLHSPAVRTRKCAPPHSPPPAPQAQPRDTALDGFESPIPDYPPPSFQEAISTPAYSLAPAPLPVIQTEQTTPTLSPRSDLSPISSPSSSSGTPLSPHDDRHDSPTGTEASTPELVTLNPAQKWEADLQLGLNIEERVVREFERQHTAESVSAFATPVPASPSARSRRCSHCGSVRPRDCSDAHSTNGSIGEHDAHTPRSLFSRRKVLRSMDNHDTTSAPSSPTSASPTSNVSSPWASSLTLSLGSALSPHTLKRKESFGVRKLFSKGKEREVHSPSDEALDTWEVVDSSEMSAASHTPGRGSPQSSPSSCHISPRTTPIRAKPIPPPPLAFVNRPVRSVPLSPDTPRSPGLLSASPASSRAPSLPFPQKSPLCGPPATPTDVKRPRRPPPPPPAPRNASLASAPVTAAPATSTSPSVVWRTGASQLADTRMPPASSTSEKQVVPAVIVRPPSQLQSAPASAALTPRPSPSISQLASPSPSPVHRDSATSHPTLRVTPVAFTDAPSPTTPTDHHYPGRPLPQPPQRIPSPLPPTHPEFSQVTDLDVFVSRLDDRVGDGRHYEDYLLVSDILGPARAPEPQGVATTPLVGRIEQERRRVMKDGRVKLKLTLLGAVVDKCGICLSQFREAEIGALGAACQHSFHERCLRRWLSTNRTCPLCRAALSLDSSHRV